MPTVGKTTSLREYCPLSISADVSIYTASLSRVGHGLVTGWSCDSGVLGMSHMTVVCYVIGDTLMIEDTPMPTLYQMTHSYFSLFQS